MVNQKPVPFMHQDVVFFRRRFGTFDRRKGDAGAASWPLPYMGEKVSALSYLHGKLTDCGYW